VIPLSFLRRLDSLKYTSVIALVSIGYLVILVVYHFAAGDTAPARGNIDVVHVKGPVQVLASFPVIVFAYTCHQNVSCLHSASLFERHANASQMFSILNEIKDNRPTRTTGVVTGSIGTAASIYVLVAITGYLSFGDNVVGNIVSQYTPSVTSTIGRAAIVVLVMFSYPLQVHPCRASVDAVSRWRPTGRRNQELTPAGGSPSRSSLLPNKMPTRPKPEDMSDIRFAVITTAIIILSYITAMTVSSLDKVLAYVGSTGSTSISFILPGLFYYKISDPDSPHHQRLMKGNDDEDYDGSSDDGDEGSSTTEVQSSWRSAWGSKMKGRQWRRDMLRKASLALAVYGFLVMVVCLATNTYFNAKE
jgi:amino acid permease